MLNLVKRLRNNPILGSLIIFFLALFYFPISLLILGQQDGWVILSAMGLTVVNVLIFTPLLVIWIWEDINTGYGCGLIILFLVLLIGGNALYIGLTTMALAGDTSIQEEVSNIGDSAEVPPPDSMTNAFSIDPILAIGAIGAVVIGVVIFVLLAMFVPPINKLIFPHRQRSRTAPQKERQDARELIDSDN